MSTFCEREFMLKNFGFHHNKPIIFVTPTFGPHSLYPFWLVLQLIYHIIALSIDGVQTGAVSGEPTGNYFLYVHNWAYLILVLSTMVDCAVTLYVHCLARHILEERDSSKAEAKIIMGNKEVKLSYTTMGEYHEMRWYLGVSWAFFTLSSVTGLVVSLLYWLLYVTQPYLGYSLLGSLIFENDFDFGTLAFTTLNAVVILIHVCLSGKPFRLLHFYIPLSFFLVYIVVTLAYYKLSGRYIYSVLDWDQSFLTSGLAAAFLLIFVPLVHTITFAIAHARTVLGRWCHIKYAFASWKRKMSKIRPMNDCSEENGSQWGRKKDKISQDAGGVSMQPLPGNKSEKLVYTRDEKLDVIRTNTAETVLSENVSDFSYSRMGTIGSDHSDFM